MFLLTFLFLYGQRCRLELQQGCKCPENQSYAKWWGWNSLEEAQVLDTFMLLCHHPEAVYL